MTKKTLLRFSTAILLAAIAQLAVFAQDKKQDVARFINQMRSARVVELNFVWDRNSPLLGLNPPFMIGLQASHKQTKGLIPGGIAFAADMMFFSGQHGSPTIDALGHVAVEVHVLRVLLEAPARGAEAEGENALRPEA